jgi:hypothetical protein
VVVKIIIDPHTLERAEERGTNAEEIEDVVRTGFPIPAKHGRLGKAKIFDFQKTRIGRHYRQKRVEVIYTMEGETSVTVTLYVFFGEWGQHNADSL